jgi:lipopolysaccharide transport system ATP-binding protein
MYMRLAFAVAAHLDPEILTVDEVLAVGDAQFQNKCLRKMNDVAEFGRTILFVSHSMASVQRLCGRCVLLEEGSVKIDGPADNVIAQYLSDRVSSEFVAAAASNTPSISRAEAGWTESDGIRLDVTFISPFPLRPPILGLVIHDSLGAAVFGSNGRFDLQPNLPDSMQEGTITVYVSTEALRSGTYYVSLFLGDHVQDYCRLDRILSVEVGIGNEVWAPPTTVIGNVRLQTRWEYSEAPVREELRSGPTEGFRG